MASRLALLDVPLFGGQSYLQKLQTKYTLTALYPLSETSGATAADASGNGRDATAVAVQWGDTNFLDGTPAPYFDGATAYVSGPAALIAAVNLDEGSMAVWCKVADLTATGRMLSLYGNAGNYIGILQAIADNTLTGQRDGGVGALVGRDLSGVTETGWFHIGMVWSVAGNYLRFYYNGAKVGADVTGLAANSQAATQVTIGARTSAPLAPFKGHLKYAIFSNDLWTDADFADLYVVPPGN